MFQISDISLNTFKNGGNVIKEKTERFEKFVENTDIAIFTFDTENTYKELNSKLCGLTGFNKDEIYSHNFPEPFWPNIFYSKIQNEINIFKSTGKLKIESIFISISRITFLVLPSSPNVSIRTL